MNEIYTALIEDINDLAEKRFSSIAMILPIIGYVALEMAGLPERGTKDIDALKTGVLMDPKSANVVEFLTAEFGKKSPGEFRHGVYLDIVSASIPWLPHPPKFIQVEKMSCVTLTRLDPADVCVSKIFSAFKSTRDRPNDKKDVISALDSGLFRLEDLILRMDVTLPRYEAHAEAPDIFPKAIEFVNELLEKYGRGTLRLGYELPSWMERM